MLLLGLLLAQAIPVDLTKHDPACGVAIVYRENSLTATWTAPEGPLSVTLNLAADGPTFTAYKVGSAEIARNLRPRFTVTTGTRITKPNERYVFFDKPASRPTQVHPAAMTLKAGRVESAGTRTSIILPGLSAGPFSGDLVLTIYAGSPLVHVEAALSLEEKQVAYIYDFVLEGDLPTVAWKDLTDTIVRVKPAGNPAPVAVRNRAIFAESETGTLALFPPPHAFFYPRDYATNFKFCQVGARVFGLRQDAAGGPGHLGAYIPWFDAPPGRTQRMGACLLLSAKKVEAALERVKSYTHGDAFQPMDGRLVFSSHWHCKLTVDEMAGKSRSDESIKTFKQLGVNIVHLAEFHGDGNPMDPGPKRLPQLQGMFDLCRKYADKDFMFLPGEEANAHLGGHWVYLFPKPVYLTLVRGGDVPFREELAPYGSVYHTGSIPDMVDVLRRERGLAWTAHPRIKASSAFPDKYKDTDWYQSDTFLGGAWKAMPGDLSDVGLGTRVLDLLDDMNTWGQRKQSHGEVDCFIPDRTHELYASMNVNYLRLAKMPSTDDWTPVLDCLRRGDFFVTTGEVLIHSFEVKGGKAIADLEWTFPLKSVELVTSDGKGAKRRSIPMTKTVEFGRKTFEWPVEPGLSWVRLEAWDVLSNGAFTQPVWLRPLVALDGWHNDEQPPHYTWDGQGQGGFSQFGDLLKGLGADLSTVRGPLSSTSLATASVLVIVDPDNEKESKDPKFIEAGEVDAVVDWVTKGGVLVLLANDKGNCEFEHQNRLASRFGITFREDKADTGGPAFAPESDHPFWKGVKKLHIKDVSSIQVAEPAQAALTVKGQVLVATAKVGKGKVFALGDPWLYNEYLGHEDNRAAAGNVVRWLLETVK